MLVDMTDLRRRRAFGPHPTAQDWRAASKADIEQALASEVIRRNPKLYAGYDEDAVKFVRNTMGTTKWDLLLAAQAFGLAPQGTYLYPDERKRSHAIKSREQEWRTRIFNTHHAAQGFLNRIKKRHVAVIEAHGASQWSVAYLSEGKGMPLNA